MKYSEAEKQIKALSSKYDINMNDLDFVVNYKNTLIAWVRKSQRYVLYNDESCFSKLPFSDKLYMILAELAITPLKDRVEENKYYIKVFNNDFGYLNINTVTGEELMMLDTAAETEFIKTKFTLKAIEQLKQREDIPLDWNKVNLKEAE